jgi:beta-lactamase regulating signal transducer with metallopeptidase domain/uncharacterized protein YnzC (UPF0291/DUF896 family)
MTGFTDWVNPETMRLMGMALLHFLWQGVAIAAVAFTAMNLLSRASTKYLVAVTMLALMVAAPAVTFIVLAQRHEPATVTAGTAWLLSAARTEIATADAATSQIFNLGAPDSETGSAPYLLWFVEAWFLGVVLLSLRPAAGFFLIERLRLKKRTAVTGALRVRCLELQRRLGLNRVVRYCESLRLEAPAVVGWFRPVVLLPVSALSGLSVQQLEAVIAHELAHVKRLDAFVNLFQIAAETLLFYHPAVWWLSKRIRAERENCCDDVAISVGGNAVEYARALATMAEWQAPGMAMAANRSPLAERVARLLGVAKLSSGFRSASIAGSVLCLCASVMAANVLLGAARTRQGSFSVGSAARPAPIVQPVPAENHDGVIVVRPAKQPTPMPTPVIELGMTVTPMTAVADEKQKQRAQENKEENRGSQGNEHRAEARKSYIDGLKAEGLTDLSIDQLVAMKVQNVTPEYVRSIHALGLKPDVNKFIAMRVQGVTPEVIRELRDGGLALDIDQIIAMKVQGITPEYVEQLHDLGIETDAGSVLEMKVQGVTSEYVRDMRGVINPKLSGGNLVAMKVQGVTPEYVRELKAMGFQLDAGDVIAMKVQGVTAEFIKGLQSAGLKLTAHAVIEAKVQGITPEFIDRARSHGFQNLSIEKLMALKYSGVLDQ